MPDARSRGRSEGLPPNSPRTTVLIYVAIIPGTGQSPGGGKGLHPFHDDTNAEICSELSLKVLYLLSYPLVNILGNPHQGDDMSKSLRSFLRCSGRFLHWGWFSAAISSSGARRLHLTLGFKTWVGYSPFYVADKEGFLAAEGLQVEFQRIEGTAERRQALIAGSLDALGTTIDDVAEIGRASCRERV